MIHEDYVSFETAKLLKEKGFDIPLNYYYNSDGRRGYATSYNWNQTTGDSPDYSRPTLQMAMKWLREVHNTLLVADYEYECTDTSYYYKIYRLGENGKPERCAVKGERYDKETNKMVEDIVGYRDYERSYSDYGTYEEACDAGIKYCLENLAK